MSVPFLVRTRERVVVPCPQDESLSDEHRDALAAYDLTPRAWPETAARFTLRGLSAAEKAQLRPLMPAMPGEVAQLLAATAEGEPAGGADVDPRGVRMVEAYIAAVRHVILRAALVDVSGVEGWPMAREEHLGLTLWPEETICGLPTATRLWLGEVAWRLATVDAAKKKPSTSPPADPTGTTQGTAGSFTAARSG